MISRKADIIVKLIRNGKTGWAKKQRTKLQQTRQMSVMSLISPKIEQFVQVSPPQQSSFSLESVIALQASALNVTSAQQGKDVICLPS